MRPEQRDLLDLTPLGLWTPREAAPDPEVTIQCRNVETINIRI